jgi:hypothetical protein
MVPSKAEQDFWTRIYFLAKQCKVEFEDDELEYMDRLLSPLGYELVSAALDKIIEARDSRDPFPSIKDIKAKVDSRLDPDTEAGEVALKIGTAITKIGPHRGSEFKEFVGEIGWAVIQSSGGLESVCSLDDKALGTHRAQWRGMALSLIKIKENNPRSALLPGPTQRPELPAPKEEESDPAEAYSARLVVSEMVRAAFSGAPKEDVQSASDDVAIEVQRQKLRKQAEKLS